MALPSANSPAAINAPVHGFERISGAYTLEGKA